MANPYELWSSRKSLSILRARTPENWYFRQFFTRVMYSEDEWVDFEKVPEAKRKLAPFVLPLARGRGIWEASQRTYRFKPAYVKVEDTIDPLMPLSFQPGVGESVFEIANDPMKRLDLIRAAMLAAQDTAVERRLEWMRARAVIDAGYTVSGPD